MTDANQELLDICEEAIKRALGPTYDEDARDLAALRVDVWLAERGLPAMPALRAMRSAATAVRIAAERTRDRTPRERLVTNLDDFIASEG